jgi:formiminoglutamase
MTDASWIVAVRDAAQGGRPVIADLFGADYSARSITPQRSDRAPAVVREALGRLKPWDARDRRDLAQWCVADHGDARAIDEATWEGAFSDIASLAMSALAGGRFTIALGGDHSVSWPVVASVAQHARHVRPEARVGVVQLDAHHDLRPLDRGPSNGTPFRGLLESGVLLADDLVQVGIGRFANARDVHEFAEAQFVRAIGVDEVRELGAVAVAESALASLRGVDVVHLSVDIDVLDRAFAPGTVAALPGGLDPASLMAIVDRICTDPRVQSMDVVEFDPERDVAGTTALNVASVVCSAVASVARRTAPPNG